MPLIQRLGRNHTIREFRAAAALRVQESTRLAVSGHRLGAIYLSGYASEMLLKAAYFSVSGWGPSTPITMSDLDSAKRRANTVFALQWTSNLHDLTRWVALLIEERKHRGRPYPNPFARSLT